MGERVTITERIHQIKEDRENLDIHLRAIKAVHSLGRKEDFLLAEELEKQRQNQERYCKLVAPIKNVQYKSYEIEGMPAEWAIPEYPHERNHVILYCHGGGYTCGSLNYARILSGKFAQNTGLEVLSFAYRLAPENPYPAAVEDAIKAWDDLMYQGYGASDVIVAGDSAGGNLALELCLKLKEQGRRIPRALLLLSPWTDMSMSGSSYVELREKDPTITIEYIEAVRDAYTAGSRDFANPKFSPLFADLEDMPPVMIQVGSNEILRSDSELLAMRLREKGSLARIEVYDGGWHVFQQMPFAIASRAMKEIGEFTESLFR